MVRLNIKKIQSLGTKNAIDKEFSTVIMPNISLKLEAIKNIFYNQYGIEGKMVQMPLNYSDGLEEFYKNLLNIKEKYSREVLFTREIDKKILEYRNYAGYDRVKGLIQQKKFQYVEVLKDSGVTIDSFHEEVLDIFQKMYHYEQKINHLVEISSKIEDNEIKGRLELLQSFLEDIEDFGIIESGIEKLEKMIREYSRIQGLTHDYGIICNRYINKLKSLKESSDLHSICVISSIFNDIIEILKNVRDGKREADILESLSKITFNDYEQDLEVLKNNKNEFLNSFLVMNKKVFNEQSERDYQREAVIFHYYETIFNQYINRLQQLKKCSDLYEIGLMSEIFQSVIEFLTDVQDGKRGLWELELLTNISLDDWDNYNNNLKLLKNIKDDSFSNIYILNRKFASIFDKEEMLLVRPVTEDEEDIQVVGINNFGGVESSCLSFHVLESEYITLERFLEDSEFSGAKIKNFFGCTTLLYSNDYVSLFYDPTGEFDICASKLMSIYGGSVSVDNEIQIFRDKNVMKKRLVEFIDDKIKEYEFEEFRENCFRKRI